LIQNATQTGLSNTLNTMYSFGLPNDYLETFQKTVSTLSPEAVKTAAQMLLGSEDSVIVIVGDYAKVKDQLSAFKGISFVDITGKPIAEPQKGRVSRVGRVGRVGKDKNLPANPAHQTHQTYQT
jgi:hypothetical protein